MFSTGVQNIQVTSLMSGNPVAIGLDVAKGVSKFNREENIRSEVEKTQGLTGFEVFGDRYTQEKTGDNMSNGNFFTTASNFLTSTLGDIATGLTNFAQPVNTISSFFWCRFSHYRANKPQPVSNWHNSSRKQKYGNFSG